MSWRSHPYLIFLLLGVAAFFGIEAAAEFTAAMIVKGGNAFQDLTEGFIRGAALWEFGVPYYMALGLICGSLMKKTNFRKAVVLFALGAAALGALGFWCAFASQHALLNHAWTASALVYLGLLLYGIPVLLACLVIRWLAGRRAMEAAKT